MRILFFAVLATACAIQLPPLFKNRDKKQLLLYILFALGSAAEGVLIKGL